MHRELWGDSRTDTRGEVLLEVVELLQFATLNDGGETSFVQVSVTVFLTWHSLLPRLELTFYNASNQTRGVVAIF